MKINWQNIHNSLYYNLLILYALSLPYFLHIGNYVLALILVNWLVEGGFKSKFTLLARSRPVKVIAFFFLLYVVSILYSSNLSGATSDVEHKLGILVIPIVIFSKQVPSVKIHHKILMGFGISCLLATSIALLIALYKYNSTGELTQFYYHHLSSNIGMHAVYLSCYICFSAFIFIEFYRQNTIKRYLLAKVGLLLLLLYILFLLLLLASKMMLIAFVIVFSVYALSLNTDKKALKRMAIVVLSLNLFVIATIWFMPYTRERFENVIDSNFEVLEQKEFRYDSEFTGLSLRLLFWKISIEILNHENAWLHGVGTGDSQEKLIESYKKYNLYQGDGHHDIGYLNYNTHSLFFEVLLKLGLIGLLYLFTLLGYILYQCIKRRQPLMMAWLLLFTLFSLTEATLQMNKGIVFFAFFYSILLHSPVINFKKIRVKA